MYKKKVEKENGERKQREKVVRKMERESGIKK